MSKNLIEQPFTELVERAAQIARLETDDSRVRGAVNDVYVRELPRKEDWSFLLVSSSLACQAEYKVGNVAVLDTQVATFTLSSDTAIDGTFAGRRLKIEGHPNVYEIVTVIGTTGGTLTPPLAGTSNVRGGGYTIYQSMYALPADFDRFPKNGGLLRYEGGRIVPIPESPVQEYYREYVPSPSKPEKCRLVNVGTADQPTVELMPPPANPDVLGYEYLRELPPMRETTAGTVTIFAGSTTVVGSAATTRFTEAQTGWYFRVDGFGTGEDSEWYRVSAIAHNSSLTIAAAFGLSSAISAGYTLSPVPLMPAKLHAALLYGAVVNLLADQDDPMVQLYRQKFSEAVVEARRLYKTRVYSQHTETIAEEYEYRR